METLIVTIEKNVLEKAIEAWNILTLTDQTHIESARAWFIEGYVHGYESATNEMQKEVDFLSAEIALWKLAKADQDLKLEETK